MALGDSGLTSVSGDLSQLIQTIGVTVNVTRTVPSQITSKSIFGTPQNYTPQTFTASIVVSSVKGNELEVIMGGKPKEIITFVAQPGVFQENDEVAYNNQTYKVNTIGKYGLSGTDLCDEVQASREVVA